VPAAGTGRVGDTACCTMDCGVLSQSGEKKKPKQPQACAKEKSKRFDYISFCTEQFLHPSEQYAAL